MYEDFLRYISRVLDLLTIRVYNFDEDANLILATAFGSDTALDETLTFIAQDERLPVIDSVRADDLILVDGQETLLNQYPKLANVPVIPAGVIALPLRRGQVMIGALVLLFKHPISQVPIDQQELKDDLELIAELCVLLRERRLTFAPHYLQPSPGRGEPRNIERMAATEKVALTPRHLQILRLVTEGLTNREIASRLNYSEGTIRLEMGKLFARLGVRSRQEVSALAHLYL